MRKAIIPLILIIGTVTACSGNGRLLTPQNFTYNLIGTCNLKNTGIQLSVTNPPGNPAMWVSSLNLIFYATNGKETGSEIGATINEILAPGQTITTINHSGLPSLSARCQVIKWDGFPD